MTTIFVAVGLIALTFVTLLEAEKAYVEVEEDF